MNNEDKKIKTIVRNVSDSDAFDIACRILKEGGLVAFPTETVYGLGGDGLRAESSEKIYAAKGRPSDNPLIIHIADMADVERLAREIPDKARTLMEAFWPGPLTVILKKKPEVPDTTTGGLDTVAIRMPSHPDAARLIRESGVLIAAPSANTSGRPSPTLAEHVIDDMNDKIDMILDGGPVGIGIESTIVDMTGDTPVILRPGYITKHMLEGVLGEVKIDKAIIEPDPNLRPKAPGMKYTHYAPSGKLTIIETSGRSYGDGNFDSDDTESRDDFGGPVSQAVIDRINLETEKAESEGLVTAVLTTSDMADRYKCKNIITLGESGSGTTVAARLYAALRECDRIGAEVIFSESFDRDELGFSIMNRLLKAAGHRVIEV